ncbi:MAG: hypothetical protein Q9182_005320 [Xanthomendoza sp. 2 TL-2023]
MLRLASTRITLTSADLDWHTRRHEKRLANIINGKQSTAPIDWPGIQLQSAKLSTDLDPWPGPKDRGREVPIYSDEPVPQDPHASKPFWDKIIADAGTPKRLQAASSARLAQVTEPFDSQQNQRSISLSVQSQDSDNRSNNVPQDEILVSPRSPESLPQSPESQSGSSSTASTQIQTARSSVAALVRLPTGHPDEAWSSDDSDEDFELPSVMDIIANVKPIRSTCTTTLDPRINQMDVDGSSDAQPSLRHYRSRSSLQHPEPRSIGMPFGAQARRAELAAFRNAQAAGSVADSSSQSPGYETPNRAVQVEYISPYSSQHLRTRSGGLPRSRLYISEVAASSSPDKRQRSMAGSDHRIESDERPRRGRKKYKRRTESPSFATSEASADYAYSTTSSYAGGNPIVEPATSASQHSVSRYADNLFPSPGSVEGYQPVSSPYHRSTDRHTAHSSSTYLDGILPYSRNVSTSDLGQDHRMPARDYAIPRQPLDPHLLHFSTRSRDLSSNSSLPYEPIPSNENAQSYILQASAPSTPPNRSSSIGLHPTPTRLSIYNDTLPAYSQPQTPQGLPRNGIPAMYLQNPFYTAPARQGGYGPRRGRVSWGPADFGTTPTRGEGRAGLGVIGDRRRVVERENQENVSAEVEAERRGRRVGMRGEEGD